MKKTFLFLTALCAAVLPVCAQIQIPPALRNDTSVGTSAGHLVKIAGTPSAAVITTAGDTAGAIGICDTACGTSDSPNVAAMGVDSCAFDGATTVNDWVQISPTIDGDCHDSGSTAVPTSGQIIGRVLLAIGSAGNAPVLLSLENGVGGGVSGIGAGNIGQQAAYNSSNTVTSIPTGVFVDAVAGAGIGAAPTAWVTATTYPLCQVVSHSGNYIAVSANNGSTTPGANKTVWYPIPNGSRPTQFDCAFYIAQSKVTSSIGVNLNLGNATYSSCIGMNYPTVGSPGLPGVNILGGGPGVSVIQQTCTLLSGSGGDGLAMINVPLAGTDFFLPRLIFSGFTLDANGLAWNFDLAACQQCFIRNIDLLNPAFGSDHAFQAGTIGGAHKGWVFELNLENMSIVYNSNVTGHGHGNGAARFTVTVSGGVPSIAVTNGGLNYDAAQLSVRLVKQGGLEACSSPGTNTPTVSGGVITAISSTATGCAATGSTFVQVFPGLQVSYGAKFSNMTDSDTISNIDTGVGSVCGIYTANVDAFNVYYKLHPQGTFDGVCTNGSETFIGTQIDSVYNHGINIGSQFNQENFYSTGFEWNNTYYEGSSDWYIQNISNPPTGSPAAINIYGEQCGNTPQQDAYAHIVSGAGITDTGSALPPRMVFHGAVMYCNQFTTATQPNFTTTAADVVWSPGKSSSYWDWSLGSGGNTILNLWHSTGNPWSQFYLNNNAATSGANANSPILGAKGAYWDGSVSQSYGWSLQTTFAAGTGPLATFKFVKNGTEPAGGHQYTWDAAAILPNGSTAITQSTGDTSTQVANDAFVSNAVAAALTGISGISGCVSNCHYVLTQGDAPEVNSANTTLMTANNVPQVVQFYNTMSRTVGNANVRVTTTSASGHFDVGLYSVSGTTATLQWHTGSQSTGTAQNIPVTPTPYTLSPGTNYLIAWCADNTTATLLGITNSGNAGQISGGTGTAANTFGTDATDTCTAGVLPSTLTTTNITNSTAASIPYVYVSN